MTYNHNGNIKSIDNLIYTYNTANGNSLTKVDDGTTHDAGFNDGSGATTEFTYTVAGNITADKNKGIDSVKYNFMGKPVRMKFSDGKVITYTYDASGNKITQKHYQGTTLQTTTDYADGFVY